MSVEAETCRYCQSPFNPGAAYCAACGRAGAKRQRTFWGWSALIAVTVVLAAGVGYLIWDSAHWSAVNERIAACAHLHGHPDVTPYEVAHEIDDLAKGPVTRSIAAEVVANDYGLDCHAED